MQRSLDDKELMKQILNIKETLGEELVILTHHYQRKEFVDLGDYQGDSFALSQRAAADKQCIDWRKPVDCVGGRYYVHGKRYC